jgi:hypothetical protein
MQMHFLTALDFACSKQKVYELLRRYERCSSETIKPVTSYVSN